MVLFSLQQCLLFFLEQVHLLLHVERWQSGNLYRSQFRLVTSNHASILLWSCKMRTLLQLIGFQSNDWVVTGLVFLCRSLSILKCLVVWSGVVLTSTLTFQSLLHPNDSLLAQRLWRVLLCELLTFFSAKVVWNKVFSNLHRVKSF